MPQREAAGGEVPGHVRGGLGIHNGRGLHGADGAAVCGAQQLGGAQAAAGAARVLDIRVQRRGLLRGHLGHPAPARLAGASLYTMQKDAEH